MIKVLQITGYMQNKDKFGNEQYQVDGLAFEKFGNYHGYPTKRVWIRKQYLNLSDDSLQKTLFAEYNDRGYIVKCEVK